MLKVTTCGNQRKGNTRQQQSELNDCKQLLHMHWKVKQDFQGGESIDLVDAVWPSASAGGGGGGAAAAVAGLFVAPSDLCATPGTAAKCIYQVVSPAEACLLLLTGTAPARPPKRSYRSALL
jgi:hypothetical protein